MLSAPDPDRVKGAPTGGVTVHVQATMSARVNVPRFRQS